MVTIDEAYDAVAKTVDTINKTGADEYAGQRMGWQHLDDLLKYGIIDQETHTNVELDLIHDGILKRKYYERP